MLSPKDALSDSIRAIPAFGPCWAGEDTFRNEDGSFTECGVYLTLTEFLGEHWQSLADSEWRALASLASDHVRRAADPASTVGACLIESMEREAYSHLVTAHFDANLLRGYGFQEGKSSQEPLPGPDHGSRHLSSPHG